MRNFVVAFLLISTSAFGQWSSTDTKFGSKNIAAGVDTAKINAGSVLLVEGSAVFTGGTTINSISGAAIGTDVQAWDAE